MVLSSKWGRMINIIHSVHIPNTSSENPPLLRGFIQPLALAHKHIHIIWCLIFDGCQSTEERECIAIFGHEMESTHWSAAGTASCWTRALWSSTSGATGTPSSYRRSVSKHMEYPRPDIWHMRSHFENQYLTVRLESYKNCHSSRQFGSHRSLKLPVNKDLCGQVSRSFSNAYDSTSGWWCLLGVLYSLFRT